MTRVATMGTSSCATIAIAGFKKDNVELELEYQKDPKGFEKSFKVIGKTPKQFYEQTLYPVHQPLGCSAEYPFSMLMEKIEGTKLKTKFIIATLNSHQYSSKDMFWPKLLKSFGFVKIDETNNTIGSRNHIFIRNPNRPKSCAKPNELD